ncbi:MAG: hypothetical protein ABI182_01395 [Candidatus Baltobacteraceae bacterium]
MMGVLWQVRSRDAAHDFGAAAKAAYLKRIVYLGGLGKDSETLSPHLRSRHEVGRVLRESGVPVLEFRAALIIGSGSVSFEMLRYLTERLPFMIAPSGLNPSGSPSPSGTSCSICWQRPKRARKLASMKLAAPRSLHTNK